MENLEAIISTLAKLREDDGHANIAIDVARGSVLVEGNRAGLIELARQVLMVASKDVSGAHQDFDAAGFASKADVMLTVALNQKLA
jgi:hypothetical protein